jgi:hypothetical protein
MTSNVGSFDSQYRAFLCALQDEITRVESQLSALVHLSNRSVEATYIEYAPVMFVVVRDALMVAVFITLARAFERNSDRSIFKLLNFTLSNYDKISWQRAPWASSARGRSGGPNMPPEWWINKQKQDLARYAHLIDRLKVQRDKFFAHNDKEYFGNHEALSEEHGLGPADLVEMVRAAQRVLGEHEEAFSGSGRVSQAEMTAIHLDNLLRSAKQVRSGAQER